jgi:hypothetical protein
VKRREEALGEALAETAAVGSGMLSGGRAHVDTGESGQMGATGAHQW